MRLLWPTTFITAALRLALRLVVPLSLAIEAFNVLLRLVLVGFGGSKGFILDLVFFTEGTLFKLPDGSPGDSSGGDVDIVDIVGGERINGTVIAGQ